MIVLEKFNLSDGTTILSCSGGSVGAALTGKSLRLQNGDDIRQTLTISGERHMLRKAEALDQRALETTDEVFLSQEEARSGEWMLVEL